ncbi:Oidioi.mRNA.OKI2018_I69.PAR.g8940.t1.cds [Oikopleura dioica]|uniref:Sulfotransferase n=1 Tax=Oikopleura dioica TaxID=34765 RepID=A0ABN7RNP2_OIKDI|nr:Oidioi.mRNA.OKI2018_I69.PAR.g8940.t1.cds [Oikopleura dioica]
MGSENVGNSQIIIVITILVFVLIFTQTSSNKEWPNLTSKYIHNASNINEFLLKNIESYQPSHGYTPKKGLHIPEIYLNRQDTSCPLAQNEKGRIDKMPNLIAVGFGKCGTGSLSFLDCHSQIVFRFVEPAFSWLMYNAKKKKKPTTEQALAAYNLPKAHESEILVEKSPGYMNGKTDKMLKRYEAMKYFSPRVKILVLLCDPMHRLWSHLKMHGKEEYYLDFAEMANEKWMPAMQNFTYDERHNILDLPVFAADLKNIGKNSSEYMKKVLLMGLYYSRLSVLLKAFGKDRVLLLDGDNLISDPGEEFGLVEEFVGVDKELTFEFATRYPYPCLDEPVPMCLPSSKGTSHGSTKQPNSTLLFNFYQKEMQMLKSLLKTFPDYDPDSNRFQWLHKYDL